MLRELRRNEYVYLVDFKHNAMDYKFKGHTYNLEGTGGLRVIGYSPNKAYTKDWENDIINNFFDDFEGTDMEYIRDLQY